MSKTWMRWAPAAVVPILVVAGALVVPASAGAAVSLPERSAAEVLASIADSADATYSGTVEQTSELGLPQLPTGGQTADAASALELLMSDHTVRVFVGDDAERVQVLDELAERNVIRNGDEVWIYSSREQEATKISLDGDRTMPSGAQTPAQLAERLIAAVEPSTEITVGDNVRVAGRAAYSITLTPRTDGTLVGSATVSVDAETGLPLAASVFARGADAPAFSVAFSDIAFGEQDAALFDFTPPPGATVTEVEPPVGAGSPKGYDGDHPRPTVTGDGWSAIVELPSRGERSAGASDTESTGALEQLTTAVDGGRVLETSLVSVFFADDGRILVGAVPAAALVAAAQ